jgi:hypothetical protein
MEALRKFLEQQLGPKTFLEVYNIMNAVSEVHCVCVRVCHLSLLCSFFWLQLVSGNQKNEI